MPTYLIVVKSKAMSDDKPFGFTVARERETPKFAWRVSLQATSLRLMRAASPLRVYAFVTLHSYSYAIVKLIYLLL